MTIDTHNLSLALLVTGKCAHTDKIDGEEAAEKIIKIFSAAAQKNPQRLLDSIQEAVELKIDGMTTLALAIFIAQSNEIFLRKAYVLSTIEILLGAYRPPKLLEFVEYLKSKFFGRGLGAKPQKLVRNVMESWSLATLQNFSIKYPKELYSLIILIHPRFNDDRGILIKKFLDT